MAVVGGALLERAVDRTLRERLRDNQGIADNLLGVDKPLGALNAQIDALYLLYGIDAPTRNALKGIAGVRNFFAHNLDASFDSLDKEFQKAMSRLNLHEGRTYYPHHLYGPDSNTKIEKVTNKRTQFIVNLKLGLIVLMRDRVSHELHTNRPFTDDEMNKKYEKRREAEGRKKP